MNDVWVVLHTDQMLCCQTTESLSLKPVILGESVTLYCHPAASDIFWLFLKPPESLVVIMRSSKSNSASSHFYDPRLQIKYSSKTLSRLFIRNITQDELGIYYCAKVVSLELNNGTKLYTGKCFILYIWIYKLLESHLLYSAVHKSFLLTFISLRNGLSEFNRRKCGDHLHLMHCIVFYYNR